MKQLKIVIEPFFIKGSEDDMEQLQQDIFEKISTMLEDETLTWKIDEDSEDDED